MKRLYPIVLIGIAALLSACIPSVNPFYTEKDVVSDARLLGKWQEKDAKDTPETWQFDRLGTNSYKLLITEDNASKRGTFKVHLFKLGTEYFLDLIPSDWEFATNQADLVSISMFPGHILARVTKFEPELELAFFDFDWLVKHLKENPAALVHRKEDDAILLTADTAALQQFVLKHIADGNLFQKPGVLVRAPQQVKTGKN